ncbi:glycosyltransferase family 2 protein [Marinobacter mangrovi]|uniref:glycosyltransferase family 2 protein n=1 Tax=Marinobacter mangrovi TaxID=2803918 RepID=UPI001933CA60|nr:glycosyltransferase family 2 protein [Marinobacter mangrovi]
MQANDLRPAIIIPVYDHEEAIRETVQSVLEFGYPILMVDDHSSAPCEKVLTALRDELAPQISLIRRPANGGKGAAVKAGLLMLAEQGYTHAIQLDADGQHDSARLPELMRAAEQHPAALISGFPEYDASVPRARYLGRYLTHIWIWINTLSLSVRDSMCGFRVYPLEPTVELLQSEFTGNRMDFDPEIMVRWSWRGHRVIGVPVRVRYPLDGVSHFNAVQDNVLISWMHTRLFFGMLKRLPKLILRKFYVTG